MADFKLEFAILKDKDDTDIKINSMSLGAAGAFATILNATLKILRSDSGSNDIKITIKEGSAVLIADGPESEIATIKNELDEIVNKTSENKDSIRGWNTIKDLISQNGLTYRAVFTFGEQELDLLPILNDKKRFRTKRSVNPITSNIVFLSGMLLAVGGKSPNIHIDDPNGIRHLIKCSRRSAIKANRYLYQNVLITAWTKEKRDAKEYELCDSYGPELQEFYNDLIAFIKSFKEAETEVESLKMIHYKCRSYLDAQNYGQFRKFVRLFIHESTDINALKTILIITQGFKDHDRLRDQRLELLALFNRQVEVYKKNKQRESKHADPF